MGNLLRGKRSLTASGRLSGGAGLGRAEAEGAVRPWRAEEAPGPERRGSSEGVPGSAPCG